MTGPVAAERPGLSYNPRMKRFAFTLSVALLLVFVGALRADQGALPLSVELPMRAKTGDFAGVLALLRNHPDAAQVGPTASLIKDLERYEGHSASRQRTRIEGYNQALRELEEHLNADRLEDALVSAIEAHTYSTDPEALLRGEPLTRLIERAQARAADAERNGDWMEVLSLYRALNLLYDDQQTFLEPLRDAERHVRVLRLYAPRALEVLIKQRAEKRKAARPPKPDDDKQAQRDIDDRIDLGNETWNDRLQGVRGAMLRQALTSAASKHVENAGWQPMIAGALEALLVLCDTPQVVESFPAFADQAKVDAFRAALLEQRDQLRERGKAANLLDATRVIDRVNAASAQTLALPEAVLTHEMADGALAGLDDFTAVIWPQDLDQFSRSFSGKFFGVGVQISKREGRLTVVSPLADTPAMKAGIKAGDFIVAVDGRDTSTWSLDKAVREITGLEGTFVTLGIERTGHNEPLSFKIKRAEIPIESIRGWQHRHDGSWDYLIDPALRIGYVRLSQFIPQSADDLDNAVAQLERDGGLNALILDLRFNPGGLLSSAVDVADRFIETGPIVSTVNAYGQRTTELRARKDKTQPPYPVVVLINQGSASASEIVSGALQDYDRALIVGERTFGKGSVQDLMQIDGGRALLKLTTQYYVLPQGRIIHRKPGAQQWGVDPDLEVKMTPEQVADSIELRQKIDVLRGKDEPVDPEDQGKPLPTAADLIETGLDPQLEAALLVLKTRLVAQNLAVAQRP